MKIVGSGGGGSSSFLGTFATLGALQAAHPTPAEGSEGHVDSGVAGDVEVYKWDDSDSAYQQQASTAGLSGKQDGLKFAIFEDQKPSTSESGSSISGDQTRSLNETVINEIGAVLAADVVTLTGGKRYLLTGSSPSYRTGKTQLSLVWGDGRTTFGPHRFGSATDANSDVICDVSDLYFIATDTTVRINQYIATARATNGLGLRRDPGGARSPIGVFSTLRIIEL